MGLYDFTFYDVICRNARIFAERPAWYEVDDGRSLTFAQLRRRVERLAAGLQAAGLQKGDRIGVLGKNSLEYFLLYGAASAVGGIALPINWRLSADEVAFNLNDCQPAFLFVDREYQDLASEIKDRLASVRSFYNLKANEGTMGDFDALLDNSGGFEAVDVATDDGLVIIHTAAVAGRPRGALLSNGNVLCANMHLAGLFGLDPADVHLNLLPLFHVGGLFMATSAFHGGALNVNMSKFDADRAVELIAAKNVSVTFDFAPILASILDAADKSGTSVASLRAVLGLESPETIERYEKTTGGTFYCMYGQTETSCLATMGRYRDCPGSAGRTIALARVRLVDDYDRPVEAGRVGEITMKGPMVFKGYWGLDADNARSFRDGWHHTGDLGRFDENGFLWYAGRKAEKELIKPGGENVYPGEVEKVIMQHPAVTATVVFGVPDPKWKEGIKAVCVLAPGQDLDAADLIEFVGRRIARFKKPQYVQFVDTLPLAADGSPDRAKVKELYGQGGC